jgi:hypothetical protein
MCQNVLCLLFQAAYHLLPKAVTVKTTTLVHAACSAVFYQNSEDIGHIFERTYTFHIFIVLCRKWAI